MRAEVRKAHLASLWPECAQDVYHQLVESRIPEEGLTDQRANETVISKQDHTEATLQLASVYDDDVREELTRPR